MAWYWIVLLVLVFLVVLPPFVLSFILYSVLLVRTKPEKWGWEVSLPDDPEYVAMYEEGLAWGEKYLGFRRDVTTESCGLKLAAQYFDFGFDRAVIIIPGRMESCQYCYYFSEPYRAAGYNVLAIDNRAHGHSEGKVSTLGYREYRDLLAWGKLLHDELGAREVYLHGVCIGASAALFALTSPDCPDYFSGMTSDGMYVTFSESFRFHMTEKNRPIFPLFPLTMMWIRIVSGADVVHDGPIYRIGNMKKPILMIQSREDIYSLPERAQELYDACGSETKKLVYFDHGAHSRVRCNAQELYDKTIRDFLAALPEAQAAARGK